MNYNKLQFLVKNTKVSLNDFYQAIGMSEVGFRKMMKMKSCKVETLELIAKYFNKPISYFFDGVDTKVYAENATTNLIEDDGLKSVSNDDRDGIIERQDKFISTLQETIKLLIDKIGNDYLTDKEPLTTLKQHSPRIKGFSQLHNPKIQSILHTLIAELEPH